VKTLILFFLPLAFCATAAGAQQPALTVWANPDYGSWEFGTDSDPVPVIPVTADDPLGIGFSWLGDASAYGGAIDGYRPGWDVTDPADPNDPGWVTADFGPTEFTGQRVFSDGIHNFTVQVRDTEARVTTAVLWIDVQPAVGTEPVPWGSAKALYFGEPPVRAVP
jgi:hypothetical protein